MVVIDNQLFIESCANYRCDDKKTHDVKFVEIAFKTLLHLTFIAEDNESLTRDDGFLPKSYGVEELVIRFLENAGHVKGAEDAVANAMSLLSRVKPQDASPAAIPKEVMVQNDDVHSKQHIMISYSWKPSANPQLVADLAFCLRYLNNQSNPWLVSNSDPL